MNWLSSTILVLLLVFQQQIHALELFDPYVDNDFCTASMATCSFELHATTAMTMFYKNLFRVVATDNGTHCITMIILIKHFQWQMFLQAMVTPKLVSIYYSLKHFIFAYFE